MTKLEWQRVASTLRLASERYIVEVLEPTEPDWRAVLEMAKRERLGVRLLVEGEEQPADQIGAWLLRPSSSERCVILSHAGVEFVRRKWDGTGLAFELDPSQVHDQATLDALLAFMAGLHDATGKPVQLFDAATRQTILARVDTENGQLGAAWRPKLPDGSTFPKYTGPSGFFAFFLGGSVAVVVFLLVIGILSILPNFRSSIDAVGMLILFALGGCSGMATHRMMLSSLRNPG